MTNKVAASCFEKRNDDMRAPPAQGWESMPSGHNRWPTVNCSGWWRNVARLLRRERETLHLEEITMRALKGWCVAAAMVVVFALVSVSTPDVRPSFAQGSAFERSLEALTLSREGTRVLGIVQGGQFSAIYPETMTRRQLRLTTVRS